MPRVNLDALIPREDFEVLNNNTNQQLVNTLSAGALAKGQFLYSSLRKPDFQRETADWDEEKIKDFIHSFLNGDLIPSIILWSAGQYTFVIDGAHRLSALIAWVNNDYGDGLISQSFFNHDIDSEQLSIAVKTRKLIEREIGSYQSFLDAAANQELAAPEKLKTALKLGILSVNIQWVQGDSDKAQKSFFKINEKSTPISETEKALLKARKTPYAIASRAIMRSGTGHQYWSKYQDEIGDEIIKIAKEINESLFTPETNGPVKTLDLPLAGKNYSPRTLPLIFDLVKLSNNALKKEVGDDPDGKATIKFLKNTNQIIRRFTTTHPSSLGLHPAVYFYSEKGRYQPTAFLAWIEIIKDFENKNSFDDFIRARATFETYIINRKNLTNQITTKYGSALKGYLHLKSFYTDILDLILDNKTAMEDIDSTISDSYIYLKINDNGELPGTSTFSSNSKSEVFLRDAVQSAPRCKICQGLVHLKSITIDHIQRKEDGGLGTPSNGQLSHPYCNSTYKN